MKARVISKIALGTVQWGMPYGIANSSGQPDLEMVRQILDLAARSGIETLDTARTYGTSEAVIGEIISELQTPFRVVTKLSPDIYEVGLTKSEVLERCKKSVEESLKSLRMHQIDTLLLHRGFHKDIGNGFIWEYLLQLKENGVVKHIGLSAVNPVEAMDALKGLKIDLIQVATSLLDQRLLRLGFFSMAHELGIEVHVRSLFLQGIAFLDKRKLPPKMHILKPKLDMIEKLAVENSIDPALIWLDFASRLVANKLILGCEKEIQLAKSLEWILELPIDPGIYQSLEVEDLPDSILDPSLWSSLG
jgi:aryl-alcohol dehydrogenase-like predicted oxidoreductase